MVSYNESTGTYSFCLPDNGRWRQVRVPAHVWNVNGGFEKLSLLENVPLSYSGESSSASRVDRSACRERPCLTNNKSNNVQVVKVVFNPPATIVFWSDGKKTVVKDESMISVIEKPEVVEDAKGNEVLRYTVAKSNGETSIKTIPYAKWKENGLCNAILKRVVPNYFSVLRKFC